MSKVVTSVDFTSAAANTLTGTSVYIDPSASLDQVGNIIAQYENTGVGVAVLPVMATDTFNPTALAGKIHAQASEYSTIIVVIDNGNATQYGVSSVGDTSAIAVALNSASGSASERLLSQAQIITSASSNTLTSEVEDPNTAIQEASSTINFGVIGALLVATILCAVIIPLSITKSKKKNAQTSVKIDSDDYPKELQKEVESLRRVLQQHREKNLNHTADEIEGILVTVKELFARLAKSGTSSQILEASVKYADVLKNISFAMNSEHYMDIALNPQYWNHPDKRIAAAERSLESVRAQVLKQIKDVNDSKDLEFSVALGALNSVTDSSADIDSIFIDKEDGTSGYRYA